MGVGNVRVRQRRQRTAALGLAVVLLGGSACASDIDDGAESEPAATPVGTQASSPGDRQVQQLDRAIPPPLTVRTAADWPFSGVSPWNTPLGEDANLESGDAVRTDQLRWNWIPVTINAGRYSHPVYRASADDPTVTVTDEGRGGLVSTFQMPSDARPAEGEDRHLLVIDPSGRWVDEMWNAQGSAEDGFTVGYHARIDLMGSGISDGVRAYGGSAIGGLIRQWELERGEIRHALALALTDGQLATGPVWPATRQDGNADSTYGGALPMGTLVAIPPDVDLSALDLTEAGMTVATALKEFGAYVVDRAGAVALYAEPTLEDTPLLADARSDWETLRSVLSVVTDNRPDQVGGAGNGLGPRPPRLSQE